MNLVVRPSDVSITEDDVLEICVELAEGQIPAERAIILLAFEDFGMSCHGQ